MRVMFSLALLVLLFVEIWIGFPINLERAADDPLLSMEKLKSNTAAEKHMEGLHLVESRMGSRDWEMFAESAEGREDSGGWELKNVKVHFYSNDKMEFTVTGKTGKIDSKSKDMLISGGVLTRSINGYRFQTNDLRYIAKERVLRSSDKVRMTAPPDTQGKGMLVEGDQLEAIVDENLMRIKDKVMAKKYLNNGKIFYIKCGIAEFSGKSKSVRFLEQVSVELDKMKMEGPEAQFQYKDDADALQALVLKGGIKISDAEKYATSDTVKFDPAENKFILSGGPRAVQNNDEIRGEQIIFIDGGKKIKVNKLKAHVENLNN